MRNMRCQRHHNVMFLCTYVLHKAKNCLSAFLAINDLARYIRAEQAHGEREMIERVHWLSHAQAHNVRN